MFKWNYDAQDKDDIIEELLNVLGDRDTFPALEHVELRDTISTGRNAFRRDFKEKGIRLILSDRELMPDANSESDE